MLYFILMNTKFSKGFTLIELLVVVSIIALLSSFILSAIKSIQQKAKQKAFRAEVMELIKAIEFYRTDNNGLVPGYTLAVGNTPYYRVCRNATTNAVEVLTNPVNNNALFENALRSYISRFPIPPTTGGCILFQRGTVMRCQDDTTVPPYVIHIINESGFEDWPLLINQSNAVDSNRRCFSL